MCRTLSLTHSVLKTFARNVLCLAAVLIIAGTSSLTALYAQRVPAIGPATGPATLQISPTIDTRPPGPVPTVAAAALSPSAIRLTWSPVPGAIGYRVTRDPSTRPQILTPTAITATEFLHTNLLPNTTVSYLVWADFGPQSTNSPGGSPVMVATTPSAVNPSGFTGSSTGGGTVGDITLRWNPAPGAAYYLVRQRNGPLVYEGSAPTVTLKSLPVGHYGYYLLAYYGPVGAAVADVTQPAFTWASIFSLPGLTATATGPGTVTVSWGLVPGAASYDILRRKVTSQGTAETAVKVAYHHVGGSITDTGLWNGVTYLYDVSAVFDPFRSNYPEGTVSVTVAP